MTPPDETWKLTAYEFAEIEGNFGCARGEGHTVDDDVLEKLRAIVDRPMVAAALARPGWRPRLVHAECVLAEIVAIAGRPTDTTEDHYGRTVVIGSHARKLLTDVRAMLDDTSVRAEPWQRALAVVEAKLREVQRDVEVKSMLYSVEVLDDVLVELRALIDA